MTPQESLLDAFKRLQELLGYINPLLNSEWEAMQHIRYQTDHVQKKFAEINAAIESKNKVLEIINGDTQKLLQERVVKLKEQEDSAYKKMADINAEIVIKRSEIEKLNAEIYQKSNILKQETKVKVK